MRPRPRYLLSQVRADLARRMVFVAGPRQVGKTTLARGLPGARAGYLNWDSPADRGRILADEMPPGPLWIFDEIHKYRRWRNYLKGSRGAAGSISTASAAIRCRAGITCCDCIRSPSRNWD